MTQPLALLAYEGLLPGSQLVNRLRELGYRVLSIGPSDLLLSSARQEKPMVILVDLVSQSQDIPAIITSLRAESETAHIPIIAFCPVRDRTRQAAAQKAGATLVAASKGILEQLPELLEQALAIE
jgi:PleD family two-component response regulator